jgi:signal transduction histidine kinase
MSFGSLRVRLLAGAAVFILAAVALSAIGLMILFQRHVERWVDVELSTDLDQLIAGVDHGGGGQLAVTRSPADPRFQRALSGLYWQVEVEPDGPVFRSRSLWDFEISLPAENKVDDQVHSHSVVGPGGKTLHLLQRRVAFSERMGGRTARVAVAIDAAEVAAAAWRFAGALVPYLAVLGALLMAAAWAQVAIGLRPLATLRRELAAIGAGQSRRLGGGFPDEVQPLAREVDTLLDARERQIEKARARASDLAHGLKTPLQLLRDDAERLKAKGEKEIADDIEDVAGAMFRHVERELARARSGSNSASVSANIATITQRVVRVMERTPEGKRVAWTVDVPAGLFGRIDPEDLTEALGNLAENAARHAASTVSVTARADDTAVVLAVIDDGAGIPVTRAQEVLRRGGRLDSSGSAGLGLAIVGDIADAWGGTLSVEVPEQGCRIVLRIPHVRFPCVSTASKLD